MGWHVIHQKIKYIESKLKKTHTLPVSFCLSFSDVRVNYQSHSKSLVLWRWSYGICCELDGLVWAVWLWPKCGLDGFVWAICLKTWKNTLTSPSVIRFCYGLFTWFVLRPKTQENPSNVQYLSTLFFTTQKTKLAHTLFYKNLAWTAEVQSEWLQPSNNIFNGSDLFSIFDQ